MMTQRIGPALSTNPLAPFGSPRAHTPTDMDGPATRLSSMVRRFWPPQTFLFLGIWLVLMLAGQSRLFHDPGALWHIVVGEQILSDRELVVADRFSCSFAGRPWIAQQWLG